MISCLDVIREIEDVNLKEIAVAVGMFDSVHIGHIAIIDKLKETGLKTCVFSFDMTSCGEEIYKKERIITEEKKIELLKSLNIDYYICPLFEEIRMMSAEDFVYQLLIKKLDSRVVVCGQDFRFGNNRAGDIHFLDECLNKQGGQAEDIQKLLKRELCVIDTKLIDNEKVSSSNIRLYIKEGEISRANKLLGRNFSLDFKIFDYKKGFLYQVIAPKFVCPPAGYYWSVIKDDNKEMKTFTVIFNKEGKRIAKTYYNKAIMNNIKVEILKKI